MNDSIVYYLWLTTKWSQCSPKMSELLMHFDGIENLYDATYNDYRQIDGLTSLEIKRLCDKDTHDAEKIVESCRENNIDIVTIDDAEFPNKLTHIYNPPIVLYTKGKLPDFQNRITVTVVGSREPSVSSQNITDKIVRDLARSNFIIVSGLAYGIDGYAHRAALEVEGTTTAFLAGGLDKIYPSEHEALGEFVMSNGGIISEYSPTVRAYKQNFSFRNRLMSGIADGVLIVQAREKSGTLLTANHALEQNKDVFVVPGDVFDFAGSNKLIKMGAKTVTEAMDIIEEYVSVYPQKIVCEKKENPKQKLFNFTKYEVRDNRAPKSTNVIQEDTLVLTENEQVLINCIKKNSKINTDGIIKETGMNVGDVISGLMMLEFKGYIKQDIIENYSIK